MKVLVIIPTHDRLEFLEEAKASVAAQTRMADELVITGNVGVDEPNEDSLATRLNRAIEGSDCDAFVMLSDDDLLEPSFLAKCTEVMERSAVDIVYTNCRIFGERNDDGAALGTWTRENIDRNTVPLVTSLCTKRAWRAAGGFDDVPLFDWHFWWKCLYTGASAYWLKEPLFLYRQHGLQVSKQIDLEESRQKIRALHERLKAEPDAQRWKEITIRHFSGA